MIPNGKPSLLSYLFSVTTRLLSLPCEPLGNDDGDDVQCLKSYFLSFVATNYKIRFEKANIYQEKSVLLSVL